MSRKQRSMTKMVLIGCIVSLTAFASIAHANFGEPGGKRQHHNFQMMAKKLGLTDAQQAQAKSVFDANKQVVKPLITNMQTERKNLHTLMQADAIDEAAIRAETAKIALIEADLNVNRATIGAQFRAILTPAQLETLKTLRQKRHNKGKEITTPDI